MRQSGSSFGARHSCDELDLGRFVGLGGDDVGGVAGLGGGAGSSVMPLRPSLKPLRPSPRPLPSSGSLRPPKSTIATTARTIRWVGVKNSHIFFSLPTTQSSACSTHSLSHDGSRTSYKRRAGTAARLTVAKKQGSQQRNAVACVHLSRRHSIVRRRLAARSSGLDVISLKDTLRRRLRVRTRAPAPAVRKMFQLEVGIGSTRRRRALGLKLAAWARACWLAAADRLRRTLPLLRARTARQPSRRPGRASPARPSSRQQRSGQLRQQVGGLRRPELYERPGRAEPSQALQHGRRRGDGHLLAAATTWASPGTIAGKAGTTPLFPNPYYNRVLVTQNIFSGGVQWRGPKNRYAAIDYHALGGCEPGRFDHAHAELSRRKPCDGDAAWAVSEQRHQRRGARRAAASTSTTSTNIAIRMQPDMIFEHFGTETA